MPNFPAVKLTDQVLGLDVQAVPLLADEILTVTSVARQDQRDRLS